MIIHKHRECDFCGAKVGINKRYFVIKSKNTLAGYAGTMSDDIDYDMCEDCMQKFIVYLQTKLKGEEDE